jgi:hypothetical protein
VTGSSRAEYTADTYKAELAITWTIVGIPLAYGVYNALKAALQLFSG